MLQLKRILLPTDFSDAAGAAQQYACELSHRFQSELHLLYVLQDALVSAPDFVLGMALPPAIKDSPAKAHREEEQELLGRLDNVASQAQPQPEQIVRAVRFGSPFVEIIRYAKTHEVNLIVMGTHGRGALAHVLLGSVAERVVQKAPCPVLTIRQATHRFEMP